MDFKELAKIAKSPEALQQAVFTSDDYDVLYHLSPIRQNLLEWYPIEYGASILEVGADGGALTALLCEKSDSVVAFENDSEKMAVNQARNATTYSAKLKLIEGGFEQLSGEQKFDYIVVAGLSRILDSLELSLIDLLNHVKNHLSANGTLLLAFDNPFGLRYFGGTHFLGAGERFGSIEGKLAHAYSKPQVLAALEAAGFNVKPGEFNIFYPVPDIRLPQEIFSQERMPGPGDIRHTYANYEQQEYRIFDVDLAFDAVCAADMFDVLAYGYKLEVVR